MFGVNRFYVANFEQYNDFITYATTSVSLQFNVRFKKMTFNMFFNRSKWNTRALAYLIHRLTCPNAKTISLSTI